jgi:hypothetical protein
MDRLTARQLEASPFNPMEPEYVPLRVYHDSGLSQLFAQPRIWAAEVQNNDVGSFQENVILRGKEWLVTFSILDQVQTKLYLHQVNAYIYV